MLKTLCITVAGTLVLAGCATGTTNIASSKTTPNADTAGRAVAITMNEKSDSKHLLDGTTIDWIYNSSGSGMILSFENGLAQYEWVTGARKGRSAKGIPYQSRKIGDDMYLINWVQPEKPDFITLIFDFKNNAAFSSGLIGYGTDRQKNLFLDGTINSAVR